MAGVRADVRAHTVLVAGYARLARPAHALRAFRAMVAAGVRPDVPAVDALVSAFFRAKAYAVARRTLLQLWPQVAPLSAELADAPLRELAVAFRALHARNGSSGGGAPKRLSSSEQRDLRRKMRDVLCVWKVAAGGRAGVGARGHAHTRRPAPDRTGSAKPTRSSNSKYKPASGC